MCKQSISSLKNVEYQIELSLACLDLNKLFDSVDRQYIAVTKKPLVCQIMRFSLYCMNESIEGRRID